MLPIGLCKDMVCVRFLFVYTFVPNAVSNPVAKYKLGEFLAPLLYYAPVALFNSVLYSEEKWKNIACNMPLYPHFHPVCFMIRI